MKKTLIIASLILAINQLGMAEAEPKPETTEVLIFGSGQYFSSKNKTTNEVNFRGLEEEPEVIPPVVPEIPDPPVDPEIPDPPIDPPVDPEIPDPPPEKDWTLVSTHEIYKNKIDELRADGVELVEHEGKLYALDRYNKNAYEIKEKPVSIWEEGREVYSENYTTNKNLIGTSENSALKIIKNSKGINNNIITVNPGESFAKNSIGMKIQLDSYGENLGEIEVKGNNSTGVFVATGSVFLNKNKIVIVGGEKSSIDFEAVGIDLATDGYGENLGEISVGGMNAIGVISKLGSTFTNNGEILISGDSNKGLNIGIKGNATNEKNGIININGISGMGVDVSQEGKFTNNGEINVRGGNAIGIKGNRDSNVINNGNIHIETGTLGIGESGETVVSTYNYGIVLNEGNGENTGIINVQDAGKGVVIGTGSNFINNGTIKLIEGSIVNEGVNISEGGVFTNNGEIINLGEGKEIVNNGGTILNKGLIKSDGTFEIDSKGIFEVGKGGVIEAKEVVGDIKLNGDLAFNNYSNEITEEILKTENYEGSISSDSILYDSTVEKTEDGYAVNLERKDFTEVLDNKGLGNYLESNYKAGNELRDNLFNEFKETNTQDSLNSKANNIFGNSILPNMTKQTLDMINYTKDTLVKNVFDSEATREVRTIAGYDYKKQDVDTSNNLSGYESSLSSIFLGADKKIGTNTRAGAVLTVGKSNSNYTLQNGSREDSFMQGNFYTQYKNEDFNYLFNGFIGGTNGELKRSLREGSINSNLRTDLDSQYFGFNNILSKDIQYKGFQVIPELQVNATYLEMDGINERGAYGITTNKEIAKSFEVGTGITVAKEFSLPKRFNLTPRAEVKYYYELGSPYKAFEGQILDISTDKFELSKNNVERGRTEVVIGTNLEREALKVYVDYKYNVQNEESLLSTGLVYKFN